MPEVKREHFARAVADVAAHGDNDTLPFDVDKRFIKDTQEELTDLAFDLWEALHKQGRQKAIQTIEGSRVFSERLLAPTGPSGFRIVTKIHPFWNVYFNGLGVAIAEALEAARSPRAHSYRLAREGTALFDRTASWRTFREATLDDCRNSDDLVIVQTDISSFYEHVYHHRIENCLDDLFPGNETLAAQIDRLLSRFAAGRSFGLPIGGQCARVLAEVLLSQVDNQLDAHGIAWRRYVDDFIIVARNHADAYAALAVLAHALADYGLTLNRTKTSILSSKHYREYVRAQLGEATGDAGKLLEIDLHFDPYSDTRDDEYDELKEVVESLNIQALLDLELQKTQPDTFLVAQIGRTLNLHEPTLSLQLCDTMLSERNLHAFRASWSTIIRGVAAVRGAEEFAAIFDHLDALLDAIPVHSPHLLQAEASLLHYLRTLRFRQTATRAEFMQKVYTASKSQTVQRACIDIWRQWADRPSFTRERNRWDSLNADVQRALWLSARSFGDAGSKFQRQVRSSLAQTLKLGFEVGQKPSFSSLYMKWKGP
jgi:hypothetical protein